ncbi:trigger factor [Xylanibacillus composti]|uniref:Trigger factor n=1 Tax=Xylanibacillus composti TaxID=1572762 RepID=A0A8J4H609_9BACL|nr:trigger factor [Xylanibacillus composti]GIQ70212.1 trigger factor [Xylanibacillus composti]
MKASWEKLENNEGVLTVEVDEQQVAKALDSAFRKVVTKVNVPGFRKGKVPRQIFEARFGVESLYQDAIDIVLPEAYMQAVQETGIEPIDRPEVDIQQFGKGETMKFTAKVQVKPEVELGEYKGLEIEAKDFSVKPEEVEAELEAMQKRHAELVVVEDEPAQLGDTLQFDFEGFVDGEAFEGGKAENYTLELGSGQFIPGFEDQMVGMKKDEEKDIEVTFPEDYHAEELKGKKAVFKVKVHEIKRKNLPELDDEFAKDVSEFETLEEYRNDIEKNLAHRKEHEKEHYIQDSVVEKAAANAKVDIPPAMIENELEQMLRDFENRLRMQGMNLELYFQFTGQSEEQLREQMKGDAEKRVLNQLVLDAIAKAENVEVSDEEVEAELEKLAEQYKRPVDEIRNIFTANGNIESLKQDLITRKTVKLLVDESKSNTEVA